MPLNLPYPVYGKVYDTDGTTLMGAGVTVKIRNNTTNELSTTTTNSASEYALDCANFASGYDNTDKITVYTYSKNLYVETTFNISSNKHNYNLTLETVSDSTLINLTKVQFVYDELDSIGESDIPAIRIIRVIQRAESEIQEHSGISFSSQTATQEIYDINQYNTYFSPERLQEVSNVGRNDFWNVQEADRVYLRRRPIISITTLQRNTSSPSQSDSWETLTEQTGSGGDYVLTDEAKASGFIDFVSKKPVFGKRRMRITYKYGYADVPKNIERLATLMAVRDIVISKISNSFFSSVHPISLRGIMVDRTAAFAQYLSKINEEIDRLWVSIGFDTKAV